MTVPIWALSLTYWLHMLATVVWIGALASLALLVLPAARRSLPVPVYVDFIGHIQRRLDPAAWFCLVVLAATGLIQMSANPNYQGFLAIDNRWAIAILTKHILFLGMMVLSGYMTWGLLPQLRRLAMLQARSMETEDDPFAQKLIRQETWLMRLNLLMGVMVLALTALARTS